MRERTPGAIHTNERSDRLARRLRRGPTFAEKQLWKSLRQLDGFHFRRQAPMGDFIVDFVCHRSRLVVEVDGGIHEVDAVAIRDAEREGWLVNRGYEVIRLTNAEVLSNIDAAVRRVLAAATASTPHASAWAIDSRS